MSETLRNERFAHLLAQLENCTCGPTSASEPENSAETCEHILENLYEFLDHEMPDELERMVEQHAAVCDCCGAAVNAHMRVREALKRSCSEHAPDELRVRITHVLAMLKS